MDEAGPPVVEHREPRKGHLALLITPIAVMVAMGYVADALWATLVNEHPLWLLGLSARNRYAVAVVNHVDLWSYYLVGTIRLLAPDPFFFALGWLYGPAALRWMEQRTRTVGQQMRRLEGWFGKWGYPLVVVFPNNYVCLIAGAARMSIPVFVVLNVVGTVGRLLFLQIIGDIFAGPIDTVLGWVSDYRIPLLVISIVVVAVMAAGELRRGRQDIESLEELERSGEHDPDAAPHDGAPPSDGASPSDAPDD